jgi:hypothetical protein
LPPSEMLWSLRLQRRSASGSSKQGPDAEER